MFSRREILKALGALPLARSGGAGRYAVEAAASALSHRLLGRTGRWVTPLGLGGQASLQWTGPNIDPADIIVRAVELGVNYLDTANAYGPSQANYGEAFRRLRLTPGEPDTNTTLRARLFVATKTGQRYALDRPRNTTPAIDELKRSLTVMFGDGRGYIPEGAYLDSIQIHNLTTLAQVDQIYEGMEVREGRKSDRIGALAGLIDFRDGTNYTGLNPERRHWVRHIGITGHQSSPVLMNALQRDAGNQIDTMLVALNANDRKYSSHQHNAVPVALARGLGIIAMKVFADGVFYGKAPVFSSNFGHVVLSVGKPGGVDSADLIRYSISLPGVACAIAGIGRIDRDNAANDQLIANLSAALADVAGEVERRGIEEDVAARHGVNTNYFQTRSPGLTHPGEPLVERDGDRLILRWNTGLAGDHPIRSYKIYVGERVVLSLPFRPQTTLEPLSVALPASELSGGPLWVEASGDLPRNR